MSDNHDGAADLQGVIDFWRLVAIVERRGYEPHADAGEVMDDQLPAVGQQRSDAVAGLEPQRQVARPKAARRLVQLVPGPLASAGN